MPERKSMVDRMRDFFDEFERDIFEAFGEMSEEHCSWDPEELCLEPLTNVIETDQEIIITADLPYVTSDNIDLHVSENMLHLEATLDQAVKYSQWTLQRQIEFQKFRKHLKLPPNVESDKINASFKNGILEIRIPKKITRVKIQIK
jgi:HSP20 family protein